ncbi:conserved hypothetical protein [Microbacterium sp. 8M]|uniref:hypothetical protein n=1 Tax=Microbacterium sp. 8M TaxID=2653153 RepID=UPI0012F09F16|nr:hypothetical protein [Microbacterium sp. 8M]VXB97948.1 conserved hypothetical protein [Microbacterium sp. 8M]
MPSQNLQDYCDWCFAPLSEDALTRSRWLGLASEDTWACSTCIEKGRYRVPPEGWNGPADEWLARDEYVLSADDRRTVLNALNEILHGPDAIEEWEFHTRIGVTREEAAQTWRRVAGE